MDEWDKGLCIESRPNAVIFWKVGLMVSFFFTVEHLSESCAIMV